MIFRSPEWFMAWRYLKASRKEGVVAVISGFSFLGILLGVATLIIVMSVMNGFRQELVSRVVGFNGHLMITSVDGRPLEDTQTLRQELEPIPGILHTAPFIQKQSLLSSENGACGGMIQGLNREDLAKRPLVVGNISQGSLNAFGQTSTILMGYKLAEKLRLAVGDKVKITAPEMRTTALGAFPKSRYFKIVGLFNSGMYKYDNNFAFIPLKDSQQFFFMTAFRV